MGEKLAYLIELEDKSRQNAVKRVAELFKNPKHLDNLGMIREQINDQKVATEAQLRVALYTQLDGTQLGINKLDEAMKEAINIRKRSHEIDSILEGLRGLSKELSETKNLAKKHAQLGAAMENMSYLIKAPELITTARNLIENDRYLDGHKIVQDMEGIRDVLMVEMHREKSSGDLETLREYFKGLEELNTLFVEKIKMIGSRLFNAVISEGNMVIECIRVIDREERADVIWQKRAQKTGFHAHGRPKRWKKLLLDSTAQTIHEKVFGSALDNDHDKNKMVRHNEAIRQHALGDLKIAKNICPIYFPPDYNIFDRIVELYHKAIAEHVECLVASNLGEKAIAQLLIWINSYRTEEFMGDPFLNIDFNRLNLTRPVTLIPREKIQELSDRYVNETIREFCSWSRNSLARHSQDWRKPVMPEVDGLNYYYTGLPRLVISPLIELTGQGKLLRALGHSVRKAFCIKFVEYMESFVHDHNSALQLYRQEYLEDRARFPYYIEFMLANANDGYAFGESITNVMMEELSDDPALKAYLTSQINMLKSGFNKLTENCRLASEEVVLMDMNSVLKNVLTPKWLERDDITANCLQGTLADYDGTLKHARPSIYTDMVNSIGEKLLLDYLKVVFTRRCPIKSDRNRRRVGEKMMLDGQMMHTYLQEGMKVREELLAAYGCIADIGRLFLENDSSMIYLDTANLVKKYPDLQVDQLITLLLARGDIKHGQAKELAMNSSNVEDQHTKSSPMNIFTKLAAVLHS